MQAKMSDFTVTYQNDQRMVECFCGLKCNKTIVHHMEKEHTDLWERWCLDFVEMFNEGHSFKQIMKKYKDKNGRLLFTWSVVERNIKRLIEEGRTTLTAKKQLDFKSWQPKNFQFEKKTLWDFPSRGNWAVHKGNYRGNFSPWVPRNLILRYSSEGQLVLDPFVGGGTTLIECWLTKRRSVGIDISLLAEQMVRVALEEMETENKRRPNINLIEDYRPIMVRDDARNVLKVMTNLGYGPCSVDLIITHPPYLDSLKYTLYEKNDLSHIHEVKPFCNEIQRIARDLNVLLKPGRICAVVIGDVRRNSKILPLGFQIMNRFLNEGFELLYPIVKKQNRDLSTAFYFGKKSISYLLAHEYLFIFSKGEPSAHIVKS